MSKRKSSRPAHLDTVHFGTVHIGPTFVLWEDAEGHLSRMDQECPMPSRKIGPKGGTTDDPTAD